MPDQLKKIAFLAPKPGMPDAAFREYWRETHGPLVAGSPGYGTWRSRYVQNHVRGRGPVGDAFAFSGIAEFWLPGASPNEDAFSATPIYRDRIRIDEMNFIDMDRTVSMTAVEELLKPGGGGAKLVIMSSRAPGIGRGEFRRRLATDYAPAALAARDFGGRIAGWSVDHVIEGSFRLPGARPVSALSVDCIEEIWFASSADMTAAFTCAEYAQAIAPRAARLFAASRRSSFLAEEHVFVDQGRPVTAAGTIAAGG